MTLASIMWAVGAGVLAVLATERKSWWDGILAALYLTVAIGLAVQL